MLSRDVAQSAMCFYHSTNNDLIDTSGFYLILRVKRWGVVKGGGGVAGGRSGVRVNGGVYSDICKNLNTTNMLQELITLLSR